MREDNCNAQDRFTSGVLKRAFHVDNCSTCLSTAKVVQLAATLIESGKFNGGCRLTKLYNDVEEALTGIPAKDSSTVTINLNRRWTEAQKDLGVVWRRRKDSIRLKTIIPHVASMLNSSSSVAAVLLTTKGSLRESCGRKANWDRQATPKGIVTRKE
ncbi:hypothetical protein AHF37_02279 [Paragonimus kellicotti]|nr:hypothetical protein AHF37_02279 [Paragonimus kellicotti]